MLKKDSTVLVIVDVQGKLAHLMYEKKALFEGLRRLITGVRILKIPILWAEQKPESLGPTIPEVAELLTDVQPISKSSFSCCRNDRFLEALKNANRNQVLLVGIETHICVYQTAADLLSLGYEVQVVSDGVSSRTHWNRQVGLEKMRDAGAAVTSTETALFELLEVAEGPQFKQILEIVK